MVTWKEYYEENERRMHLLDEARQYRLIKALADINESRSRKALSRILSKQSAYGKEIRFEYK